MTASPPFLSAPAATIAPGTLLATVGVTTTSGVLDLAARAADPVVSALGGDAQVRSAHVSLVPGADVPAGTSVTVQAEATVTALLPSRAGTVAEVAVTLTESPSAEVPTDLARRVGTVELSLLTALTEPSAAAGPGSRPWATLLDERLRSDEEFAQLIETYDGTIGLRIAGREVHIRCYRGQVLEVAPRSIRGADFIVDMSGAEFVALMTGPANTFMESAMQRRLSSSGSGYEYLRMTTALIRIIDVCRAIAADDGWGHPAQNGATA